MKKIIITLLFVITIVKINAQGILKGTILDSKNKETMVGSTVRVLKTNMATVANEKGVFQINNVPNGKYTIEVTMIGYLKSTVLAEIINNETVELNVNLVEEASTLSEVQITSFKEKATELAIINEIKGMKALAVGIGAAQIQKAQDRDAAAVVRRLAGVSIQDDRYVIIRGLNERYNTVLLNQSIVPSSETDTKAFSFDLIPAGAIDRIVINKSNSAENPGEFGGGLIKVFTKTLANENDFKITFGTAFRQYSTFQKANIHQGNGLDYLGLGGLNAKLPNSFPSRQTILNNYNKPQISNKFNELQSFYTINSKMLMPDIKFGLDFNRIKKFENGVKLSSINTLNYNHSQQIIPNVELNRYLYNANAGTIATEQEIAYNDQAASQATRIGLLSNWALIFNSNHKIEWTNLINQLGNKETVIRQGTNNNNIQLFNQSMINEQKTLVSSQLTGTSKFKNQQNLTWVLGLGFTNRLEPDNRRYTSSKTINSDKEPFEINIQQSNSPTLQQAARFFSTMNEKLYAARADYEKKNILKNLHVKTGIWGEYKFRTFEARWFGLVNPDKINSANFLKSPQEFFNNENISKVGLFYTEGTGFEDKYQAKSTTTAGYVQGEFIPNSKWNTTFGVRNEYNIQQLATKRRGNGLPVNVYRPLNVLLPSANVNFVPNANITLRLAYSKTVNRPEFRELAPFPYYDFTYDVSKIGNTTLKSATINNLDFGIQKTGKNANQLINVTFFYKQFTNPIEAKILNAGSGISFGVANSVSAYSGGVEIDITQPLIIIGLKNTVFRSNLSLIKSSVNTSFNALNNDNRYLQGQSPYLFNMGLYHQKGNYQASILYNVVGPRVYLVGNGVIAPTVYEMPRNQIDVSIQKKLTKKLDFKLGVQDLLNQAFRYMNDTDNNQKIEKGKDDVFRSFNRGSSVNIGLSIKI